MRNLPHKRIRFDPLIGTVGKGGTYRTVLDGLIDKLLDKGDGENFVCAEMIWRRKFGRKRERLDLFIPSKTSRNRLG